MQKFLVLYGATAATVKHWQDMSKEDQDAGMAEWNAWEERHAEDLLDKGTPVGKNKRVTKEGATDESNEICGYCILQAESQDKAAALLEDNPHLATPGVYLEVMPLVHM